VRPSLPAGLQRRDRRGGAGDLQIRDLRRTGASEAANAGATPAELMAVGGWTHQASIRPNLVQTRQQAASVQAKRDTYRRRLPLGLVFPTVHT